MVQVKSGRLRSLILFGLGLVFLFLFRGNSQAQPLLLEGRVITAPGDFTPFPFLPLNPLQKGINKAMEDSIIEVHQSIWTNPNQAVLRLTTLLKTARANLLMDKVVSIYTELSLASMARGDYTQSYQNLYQAYLYLPFSNLWEKQLTTLFINIGAAYTYQVRYEEAAKFYFAIMQYLEEHKSKVQNLLMAYNNLSDIFIRLNQFDQATKYLNKAKALAEQQKNSFMIAYIDVNMAEVEAHNNNLPKAKRLYYQALRSAKTSKNIDVEKATYSSMGNTLLMAGEEDSAIHYFKLALSISSNSFPYYATILPYYNLGKAYLKVGDYHLAEDALKKGLEKANATEIWQGQLDALSTLANTYHQLNQPEKELATLREYMKKRSIFGQLEKQEEINRLDFKYQTAQKDKQIAESRVTILSQEARLQKNRFWVVTSSIVVLVLTFLLIILHLNYKHRNKIVELKALIDGEEKERGRIAQELHDGIGGMLAAVQMQIGNNNKEIPDYLPLLTNQLKNISQEVRNVAHNLLPDSINRFSLEDVLNEYCQNIQLGHPHLIINMEILNHLPILTPELKLTLFRIVQEALQNTIKHASAKNINLQLSSLDKAIYLLIEDDGKGFNPKQVRRGLGLSNMESRVKALKGFFEIESGPKKGTVLHFEFLIS